MRSKRVKLDWHGERTLRQVTNRATAALNEIDRTAERHAKAELYPGHGVRTGALRRSIAAIPAVTRGRRIIGGIATLKGDVSAYARVIHRKYEYLTKGLQKTVPSVREIIDRHMRG